jgi:hypothetical protein
VSAATVEPAPVPLAPASNRRDQGSLLLRGARLAPVVSSNVDAACGVKLPGDKESRKVTLDGLLNALDGVQRGASKRIIVATTNYPEKLMPSLRRRGRLGLSFQIDYPSDATMTKLIGHSIPGADAAGAVASVRAVERRLGLPAPTAALTDVFAKAGLRAAASGQPAASHCAEAIAQVEEVLEEVASTNKKVFRHVGELLDFLGLTDEVTSGDVAASQTAVWARVEGEALPARARELGHAGVAAALAKHAYGADSAVEEGEASALKALVTLAEDEWKALGAPRLRFDHYVRVDGAMYMPVETGDEEKRPKTYAEAFEAAACTDVRICKTLDDQKLSNDLKIEKVGHRMMLLEQFKFL